MANPTFVGGLVRGVQAERAEDRAERGLRLQEGAFDNATERLRQQDEERQEKLRRQKSKDKAEYGKTKMDIGIKTQNPALYREGLSMWQSAGEDFGFGVDIEPAKEMDGIKEQHKTLMTYAKEIEKATDIKQINNLVLDMNMAYPTKATEVKVGIVNTKAEQAIEKMKRQSGIDIGAFTEKEVVRKEAGLGEGLETFKKKEKIKADLKTTTKQTLTQKYNEWVKSRKDAGLSTSTGDTEAFFRKGGKDLSDRYNEFTEVFKGKIGREPTEEETRQWLISDPFGILGPIEEEGEGGTLSEEDARVILDEAGGDVNKARQIAKDRGLNF